MSVTLARTVASFFARAKRAQKSLKIVTLPLGCTIYRLTEKEREKERQRERLREKREREREREKERESAPGYYGLCCVVVTCVACECDASMEAEIFFLYACLALGFH